MITFTPDTLIELLGWRPSCTLNSMVCFPDEPIKQTVLARTPMFSSLGLLDTLPTELLYIVLNSSDCQSLSRMARVCHRARALVESLLSYQVVMKHATPALIALSQTKVITFHSVATIHGALLSDKCVSCQRHGHFLFLPTCERCCYECLEREPSLRVITIRRAEVCFGIPKKDLCRLPLMLATPEELRDKKVRLVSLKHAEKLGLSLHGSQEAMEKAGVLKENRIWLGTLRLQARWLTGATLDSEPQLSSIFRSHVDSPLDPFHGSASISFPPLRPNGELEIALWCFGCRTTLKNYYHAHMPIFGSQTPMPDLNQQRFLWEMGCQARSRSEFLEHIKDCNGARDVLGKVERTSRQDSQITG